METLDQSKFAEMPIDQFKEYLSDLKVKYDQAKQTNTELNEKLHRQMKREQRMKEEHKQAILQAETVNMMTKYQLVFVKMENQFSKIFNTNKLRNLKFKQEAFQSIKGFAIVKNAEVNFKTHLIYEKFRNKIINNLINNYSKKIIKTKHIAFQQWKTQALLPQFQKQTEELQSKEIDILKEKQVQKEKERLSKEQFVHQKETQYKQLMHDFKKYKSQIEEQEHKERLLSQEIQALIYKNTTSAVENQKGVSSVFSRAQMLEQSLQSLKKENKSLREKLEMTELNMHSFIREMGTLIDQHELGEALSDILNEQYPTGGSRAGRNDEEGGGSTGGSIRRTKQQ